MLKKGDSYYIIYNIYIKETKGSAKEDSLSTFYMHLLSQKVGVINFF